MGKITNDYSEIKITHEHGVVVGNVHNKIKETNPVLSLLIKNYYRNLNDLVLKVNPNSIHEVGCGEGHVISQYTNKGISLSGSDFSHLIIEKAQSEYGTTGINFITRSVYELTKEESADLILCCEVLEHLEKPTVALEKVRSIANPYAIFAVPNEPFWRISNVLRGAYLRQFGNTPGHIQHWDSRGFTKLIERDFQILLIRRPYPWLMALAKKR